MKNILSIVLFFFFSTAYCQHYSVGDTVYVNSINGLNLRGAASENSCIQILLQYGEALVVTLLPIHAEKRIVSNIPGNWIKVESGKEKGYIFDAFLSAIPVIPVTRSKVSSISDYCPDNLLRNYIFMDFGVVDSMFITTTVNKVLTLWRFMNYMKVVNM